MAKMNEERRYKEEKDKSKAIGVAVTIVAHLLLLLICFNAGFNAVYPPPQEKGILMEFNQDEEIKPIQMQPGKEPRAENADPSKEIKLVQRSEGQLKSTKPSNSTATTVGDKGDIEKYEKPKEKPIDKRALFSSANNNTDSIAEQTADKISSALKAGHPKGNTNVGNVDGTPSARLKGRNVMGTLPFPSYTVNKEGKVVVKIRVDQYGKVINAIPGVQGTTVQDRTLWEAAKKAAMGALFNVSSSAPVIQEGTITYIFKLK
jgi:hypothetical protein